MSLGCLSLQQVLGRNTIHPFPARMAPGLALEELSNLRRPSTVLDPMVGSGTTLAIARANGHRCIGFDVDPLAVLVSRVWTRTLDGSEVRRQASRVLKRAEGVAANLVGRDAYPIGADEETRAFVRYWFDGYVRRQLAALSIAISDVSSGSVRETLWCAFSRLIIAKQSGVSLALDLAHSRPHRVFDRAPRKPFRLFLDAVERVIAGCVHLSSRDRGPLATVELGDVRALALACRSVDLVVTSPPYLNAIDYLRCSKFSLVWMGYSVGALRQIRATSIGAEVGGEANAMHEALLRSLRLRPALSPRMSGILRRYVEDTDRALKEVARVLAPQGRAVYVVGENTIRGTYLPTAQLVTRLAAQAGLQLTSQRFRNLVSNRRYLPPPGTGRTAMDTRMRREVVLTFEQPRQGILAIPLGAAFKYKMDSDNRLGVA
jgi:hypothetical protein